MSEETRWYVPCGCYHHGDHLGCEASCKEHGGGCQHPLGVEVTAPTEKEADEHVHGPGCWTPAMAQRYAVMVTSEPLPGLPSHRIYGPFESYDKGRLALMHAGIITPAGGLTPGWAGAGVVLFREVESLVKERP